MMRAPPLLYLLPALLHIIVINLLRQLTFWHAPACMYMYLGTVHTCICRTERNIVQILPNPKSHISVVKSFNSATHRILKVEFKSIWYMWHCLCYVAPEFEFWCNNVVLHQRKLTRKAGMQFEGQHHGQMKIFFILCSLNYSTRVCQVYNWEITKFS